MGRELQDGRYGDIIALTFGRARIVVSQTKDSPWYLDGW